MKHMTFGHILLTRFSYRMKTEGSQRHAADDGFSRFDPLDPTWLDFRFALFEFACLPNVMGQSNQDFDWVLVIDPDLPMKYRRRLEALIAKRKRTHLHEFSPSDNLATLDWLEKYIPSGTDLALTTNLDDDDILTVDFVEKLQSHVKGLGTTVPSIKCLGMKTTYQWELYSSAKYPLGTWAPWHRANWFRSTGLSVLCKISAHRLTCFSLHHFLADVWYAQGNQQQLEKIARETWSLPASEPCRDDLVRAVSEFHQQLEKTTVSGGEDWKSLPPEELYYDLSRDGLFAVHLNHFMNDQVSRLFEHKPGDVPVVDMQFFPDDFRIDWNSFHKHRGLFKLSLQQYKKYLSEINIFVNTFRLNWWRSILASVIYRIRLTWWFLRH